MRRIRDLLNAWSAHLGDPVALPLRASSLLTLIAFVIAGAAFVAANLHQSSIGVWDERRGPNAPGERFSIGTPKPNRSDEWSVQTPWILDQVHRGMPAVNPNVGGAEAALVAGTPVLGWSMGLTPKYWGFLTLGIERGFSFMWAVKAIGLLGGFFLLFLALTRGHTTASLAGAAWVFGSSFVQWWYSSHITEHLSGFAAVLTGTLLLLRARRRLALASGVLLCVFGFAALLLHPYPAFIVPLGYVGAFVVVGALTLRETRVAFRQRLGVRIGAIAATLAVWGTIVAVWMSTARGAIDLITNTVYPGARSAIGGAFPWPQVWDGMFEALRWNAAHVPYPNGRPAEVASFLVLAPLLLLLVDPRRWGRPEHRIPLAALLACLVTLAWMSWPIPSALRAGMATLGWSHVPARRAEIAVGIASIIAVIVWLANAAQRDRQRPSVHDERREANPIAVARFALIAAVAVGAWVIGLALQRMDPAYFSGWRLVAGSALTTLIAAGLIHRSPRLTLAGIVLFIAPASSVNPIQAGLASVLDKPFLNLAVAQGGDAGDRWVVIGGDWAVSQALKARGLDVVTGSQYTPNPARIAILDPSGEHAAIWNRYAHVVLRSDPTAITPTFTLVGGDRYEVAIDVCGSDVLTRLGVNRVAYTIPVPASDQACLIPLSSQPGSGVTYFALPQGGG